MKGELLWAEYPQYEGTDVFEQLNEERLEELKELEEHEDELSPPNIVGWFKSANREHPHDFGGWTPGNGFYLAE